MKVRDLLKALKEAGWLVSRQRGSHRQLKHMSKPGKLTVAGHPSEDVHPKTLATFLRQAGIE